MKKVLYYWLWRNRQKHTLNYLSIYLSYLYIHAYIHTYIYTPCHLAHSTFNSLVPSTVFFPKLTNAWMPSWMGNSLFPIDSHLEQFLLERIPLNQAKCVHSASIYILGPCSPYPFPTPNPQSCWSHDRVLQIFKNNLQVPSNPAA